jgi:hypothetical protein
MITEKSLPQPSSPQAKGRVWTRYTILWVSLAALSALYLGLVFAKPATVASVLGAGQRTAETEADSAKLNEAVTEVRSLRETIDLFRSELIEVRAQLSSQTESTRDLTTRLSALETAEADRVAAIEATSKDAKGSKTAKAKGAEPAERTALATPADKKAAKDKDAASKKAAQKSLETGSVEQPAASEPPITFGPPTVTTTVPVPAPGQGAALGGNGAAGNLFGVQIATGPSVDSLRLSWTLLNERHGDTLRTLEPRYKTDASGGETSYDLVVGPVADADAARRLCQELAVKATPCAVSRFTGSAL